MTGPGCLAAVASFSLGGSLVQQRARLAAIGCHSKKLMPAILLSCGGEMKGLKLARPEHDVEVTDIDKIVT